MENFVFKFAHGITTDAWVWLMHSRKMLESLKGWCQWNITVFVGLSSEKKNLNMQLPSFFKRVLNIPEGNVMALFLKDS